MNTSEETNASSKKKHGFVKRILHVFFCTMLPLFFRDVKKDLQQDDLEDITDADLSKKLGDDLEKHWLHEVDKSKSTGKKPRLLKALIKSFLPGYLFDGFLSFLLYVICKPFVPHYLGLLLTEFNSPTKTRDKIITYAAGVIILSLFSIILSFTTIRRCQQRGMRIRIACCSLLYRKMLRLNLTTLTSTTAGQLVNIMSNDVNRFDYVLLSLHIIWIMPFQIVTICYLMYLQLNVSAFMGVLVIVSQTLPVQAVLGKLVSKLRRKIAERTDERVRLMHEIVKGIQVIKMYAWEKPFEEAVSSARQRELSAIMKVSHIRGYAVSSMLFLERASLHASLMSFTLSGNPISAAVVFSFAQFFNKIQDLFAFHFPTAVSAGAETLISIKRVEEFLKLDEFQELYVVNNHGAVEKTYGNAHVNQAFEDDSSIVSAIIKSNVSIEINNVTATWTDEQTTLSDITLTIEKGKLHAIVGVVGSGKSSLLHLLLKEITLKKGIININGTISYASQDSWLFVDSIKNNILFGEIYDENRYKKVVEVCALQKDFDQFPYRDQSLIGERGISLSGGQKARINLARTLYKEADIYILDDPLSAVDAHVGRYLFQKCIEEFLKDKTRIIVTHQLHYLKTADTIIVMERGKIENVGTYEELLSSDKTFSNIVLLEDSSDEENDGDKKKTMKKFKRKSRKSSIQDELEDEIDKQEEIAEESKTGESMLSIFLQYWKAGRNKPLLIFLAVMMLLAQLSATSADYWVTFWSSQYKTGVQSESFSLESNSSIVNNSTGAFDIWEKIGPFNSVEYIGVYTIIIFCCVFLVSTRSTVFFITCMKSSKGLHDTMFNKILRTKMKFFNDNPSGRILNRFSKDIGSIDEMFPQLSIQALQIGLVFCSIVLLITITNVWLLIPLSFVVLMFVFSLHVYLTTAQNIKDMELKNRSPIYSHVTSSLNGIVTIRNSQSQSRLTRQFEWKLDNHTSLFKSYIEFSCTLGFWMDIGCIIFLTCVCSIFIYFDDDKMSSSNVGLAISQTLILIGMLQFGVRLISETFVEMISVERVLQYSKLGVEQDDNNALQEVGERWPENGKVLFNNVCLRYSEDGQPILKNITFNIDNGSKIGIVGRTGAGKSSLIAALFRLAEISGKIEIDGIDTANVSLEKIRSNISIIPQNPILFSGSIRYNLDPLNKYEDPSIWSALETVGLKHRIQSLDYKITEDGGNLSVGQKQLMCLARAILRNNKILVMDEATANVDHETDLFIQKTIREKFANSTVLTIAHRLNTIIDCNRILVIDSGNAVEYDHPFSLLQNQNSQFFKIVQQTGSEMAENLLEIAKNAYYNH